jgi:hypothetical protein
MRRVLKYPLLHCTDSGVCNIELPKGAKPLSVGLQRGLPTIWAEVDTHSHEGETWTVFVLGTGWAVPENAVHHLGTVFDGSFVWHVYLDREV